ncbi:MAG: 4'-phosphopantetheinyl transferase superfamily protein [Halopseudomonas sp.]|uniref:4'-phosphopantetheinyl transferase family protein n=1 Tax=Halopseudomonas sp. TaxID=2901191 RepID=UPI003002DE9F
MLAAPVVLLCEYPTAHELEPCGGWQLSDAQAQQRLQQLARPAVRTQFALSRLLLERAAQQLLTGASDWALVVQRGGQPLLRSNAEQINLSISHTAGLVAVALAPAGQAIGVDVEAWSRPLRLQQLLAGCMSKDDADWCLGQASPEQAFLRHWTLKEAYLKALGRGIAADLPALSFGLQANGIALRASPYSDSRCWQFAHPPLLDDHCLALAWATTAPKGGEWREAVAQAPLPVAGCKVRQLRFA